ncbi:hypothetical protein BE17_17125 [Sorangium cellulosum]|uniref:Uncharacterized protein n=1 Tax=Sorangium cellulosum TaxID=56 RepID=A0A150RXW0_SORCE|nr:hypothetical protein BE17_17125 [Sorangium cellulosum]
MRTSTCGLAKPASSAASASGVLSCESSWMSVRARGAGARESRSPSSASRPGAHRRRYANRISRRRSDCTAL